MSFLKPAIRSVDTILYSFHTNLQHLEDLIKVRAQAVESAVVAEAKAIEQRVMHSAEIQRAQNVIAKIKELIS